LIILIILGEEYIQVMKALIMQFSPTSCPLIPLRSKYSPQHPVLKEPGYRTRYSDWLRAGRPRCRSSDPCRVKNVLFSTLSRPTLEPTESPVQWVPGVLSPGVKRPGREPDHSHPASAEVKKMWIYTSTTPYAFME
jgi:hypothetical protein